LSNDESVKYDRMKTWLLEMSNEELTTKFRILLLVQFMNLEDIATRIAEKLLR
jgi:hypothetical protein